MAQVEIPSNGDWITTVLSDLKTLEVNLSLDEIQRFSNINFKKMIKKSVRVKATEYLLKVILTF